MVRMENSRVEMWEQMSRADSTEGESVMVRCR